MSNKPAILDGANVVQDYGLQKKKKKQNQQSDFDHSYFQKHGYSVTAEIGRGGYGTVYLVKEIKEPIKNFAVKINFDVVSRPIIFLESTIYYLLKDKKCIPKLHDIFCEKSIVHIVLEYFDHVPYIQLFHKMNELQKVKHYMIELLKCLHVLKDAGIYHRDIKPQNFLYNPDKKKGVLVDFGLAELDRNYFHKIKKIFKKFKKNKDQQKGNEEYLQMKSQYDLYKQLYKATKQSGRKKIGTQSYVSLESLIYADKQSYQCQIWSAGTILLQFLCKKYHFFHNVKARNESPGNQFKYIAIFMLELAHLFGAQDVQKVLEDSQYFVQMPYKIKKTNLQNIITLKSCKQQENQYALDILTRMLDLRPRKRISVEDALMHPFFDSVRQEHMDSPEDKKWIQDYLEAKKRKQEAKQRKDRIQLSDFQLNSRDRINMQIEQEQRKKKINNNQSSTKGKTNFGLLSDSINNKDSDYSSEHSHLDSEDISDQSMMSSSEEDEVKPKTKTKSQNKPTKNQQLGQQNAKKVQNNDKKNEKPSKKSITSKKSKQKHKQKQFDSQDSKSSYQNKKSKEIEKYSYEASSPNYDEYFYKVQKIKKGEQPKSKEIQDNNQEYSGLYLYNYRQSLSKRDIIKEKIERMRLRKFQSSHEDLPCTKKNKPQIQSQSNSQIQENEEEPSNEPEEAKENIQKDEEQKKKKFNQKIFSLFNEELAKAQ